MVMVGRNYLVRECNHFYEDYGLDVKVARYHNVYGPCGTYDGGREKAPAALARKVITAKNNADEIEVWAMVIKKDLFYI